MMMMMILTIMTMFDGSGYDNDGDHYVFSVLKQTLMFDYTSHYSILT